MKTHQLVYLVFRRVMDIFASFIGILFCFTFFWWWILIVNTIITKGHPMFNRYRIGKNSKPFIFLKFRSMTVDADPHMSSLEENSHMQVTKFGSFLRKTSLDETPQLLNIFIGQMSFIGPRPLVDASEDIATINKRKENGSDKILPGLTGYAQIHNRGELEYLKKAEYDYYYYKNFSLWLDIKIFFITIFQVFKTINRRK